MRPHEHSETSIAVAPVPVDHRLRKHADYQRVYREGRKHFSASMSYFYALRAAGSSVPPGPRVGLTAGKVLGNAVERNRIKRRMRDIVRRHVESVAANVDIVLHPRKSVLTIEFPRLESEVVRIFDDVQSAIQKAGRSDTKTHSNHRPATPARTKQQRSPRPDKAQVAS